MKDWAFPKKAQVFPKKGGGEMEKGRFCCDSKNISALGGTVFWFVFFFFSFYCNRSYFATLLT